MSSESGLWKTLSKRMKKEWVADRIECVSLAGVPDVYFTTNSGIMGWLELKYAHEWPKRQNTVLRLNHFTTEQRNWIRKHGKQGARVFLLLQVDRDYLLFSHSECNVVGKTSKRILFRNSIGHWYNSMNINDLLHILENHYENL